MAELLFAEGTAFSSTGRTGYRIPMFMSLYCWPCRTVHELALTDVEKIVYALGGMEMDAINNEEMPSAPQLTAPCLRLVLQAARNPEAYGEHVEQGIECREKTPVPEVPYDAASGQEVTEG